MRSNREWLDVLRAPLAILGAIVLLISAVTTALPERTLPLAFHTLKPDDAVLTLARDAGARFIVEVFAWNEIEPTRGEFHWEQTDWLVRAATYYGMQIIARLDKPPNWATGVETPYSAPPSDFDTYANFVARVAARYQSRISAYIVWNEPNLAREWGDQPPDPNAYADLLKRASNAIKKADPNALVLAAGLAPTNQNDASAMDDRTFLSALYNAGGRESFDLLAIHPYTFGLAPDAPHLANGGLNFTRIADWHTTMANYGDADKPMWITEFGYTTDAPQNAKQEQVDENAQASFIAQAYALTRAEYPYVQLFTVWNLARARELPNDDEQFGYSLFRADDSLKPSYQEVSRQRLQGIPVEASALSAQKAGNGNEWSVLAPDVVIHLGDSEYPTPWVPLYQNQNPAPQWTGEFYLLPADLNVHSRWTLTLETMQANELDNHVFVDDHAVIPPTLGSEDFTGIWVNAQFEIPSDNLHPGANTVTLRVGKLIPAFQQLGFTWDDLQVRNVVVRAD